MKLVVNVGSEEGWFGQPKYCYKKLNNTRCYKSDLPAVVFGPLVFNAVQVVVTKIQRICISSPKTPISN